ncbi:MAG: spermidine/putrescine ABC transporter permease PotB [Desulfoprunum sp.]|nr:spermidine/putrescine ABC transporter permease PotB [Desulfoprunum sp.]
MKNNSLFRRLVIIGVLAWICIFALLPNLLLLIVSFLQRGTVVAVEPILTLTNYGRLFEASILRIVLDSLTMAGMAMVLCLIVGYPLAYIIARAKPGTRHVMLLLVMIPFWTNSLIRTYALVAVLKVNGVLNMFLLWSGLITEPLRLMYTPTAVFIGLVYTLLPFMILPLYAAIIRLDARLLEAARDLGASRLQAFRHVTLPLTMPGIISGSMLVFLPALGMFYVADVLGGARSMLLGNYIRDQFLTARNLPMGSTASIAMTLIMGLMLLVYYYSIKRSGRPEEEA